MVQNIHGIIYFKKKLNNAIAGRNIVLLNTEINCKFPWFELEYIENIDSSIIGKFHWPDTFISLLIRGWETLSTVYRILSNQNSVNIKLEKVTKLIKKLIFI